MGGNWQMRTPYPGPALPASPCGACRHEHTGFGGVCAHPLSGDVCRCPQWVDATLDANNGANAPVPPASAPAATPEPESCAGCGHAATQHAGWIDVMRQTHSECWVRDCRCKAFVVAGPAAPTGEEAVDTMLVTDAALAYAEYTVQDEDEAAAIRQACARLTAQATALAALRARVEEASQAIQDLPRFHCSPHGMQSYTGGDWISRTAALLAARAALAPRQTKGDVHG